MNDALRLRQKQHDIIEANENLDERGTWALERIRDTVLQCV